MYRNISTPYFWTSNILQIQINYNKVHRTDEWTYTKTLNYKDIEQVVLYKDIGQVVLVEFVYYATHHNIFNSGTRRQQTRHAPLD